MPKKLSKELMMLSSASLADRDRQTRNLRAASNNKQTRKSSSTTPNSRPTARTVTPSALATAFALSNVRNGGMPALQDCESDSDSDDEEEPIRDRRHPTTGTVFLDIDDASDDDSDYSDDEEDDVTEAEDEEDDDNDKENNKFECPPLPKGKGKHSFEAIQPVNFLLPSDVTLATFDNLMVCPAIDCPSKAEGSNNYHSLETTYQQYGFATELYIQCKSCGWGTAICPMENQTKGDTPNTTPQKEKKKKFSERDSEMFHKYGVNYNAHFLMQKLGLGLRGLDLAFALLGIAPNHGSKVKWNRIANRVGLAEALIAEEVMEENRKLELDALLKKADEFMEEWTQSEEAITADEDDTDRKRSDYLYISEDGKYGITISCDGAWQKRKIGKNGGDSTTGHNFALGGITQKIVGLQCHSKHCRLCEAAEKKGKVVKDHRCPRNYNMNESAKSMEPMGAVQHCVDISNGKHNIYVATMVTDDDATTRANVQHSYHDICEKNFPGTKGENGKIPSRMKRQVGWPTTNDNKLKPENPGKLPMHCNVPQVFLSDPQHRIRSVGSAFYACKTESTSKKKGDDGLLGAECEKAKRAFGFYLKKNQHYSLEDFMYCAPCVVYHMFNQHQYCNVEWCTSKQAELEKDPEKKLKIDDPKKYRKTDTPAEKKLFERVKAKAMPLLSPERMKEVYHPCQTQKNETLQRQATATCPKDRFLGGRMTLYDRLRLIVVVDSLGEFEGMSRLYHSIGLPPLNNCLALWAAQKDKEDKRKHEHRKKPEVKKKRSHDKVAANKEAVRADKRAKKAGVTYESGIANKLQGQYAAKCY